jgi:urease accessory protein
MIGHMHLVCLRKGAGTSHLSEQSFRAPLHLSKPHLDGDTLVVNMVNPTAGIFDDDEIEVSVRVEAGARMVLTTPSASRVYRSRSGGTSQVRQRFEVRQGGFLEYFPEPFIPQAGARYCQRNEVAVERGGALLCFEWLTPGRVASGESFQYHELRWETDVRVGDKLTLRERYCLRPEDNSLESLKMTFPSAHYVSCIVIGTEESPQSVVEDMPAQGVYGGVTALAHGGFVVKLLCEDSLRARQAIHILRQRLHESLRSLPARLGRA